MNLQELKRKSPAELLAYAEELQIENASNLRKQDMMFAILKQLAENDIAIFGDGVLEILQDGFGFLRSPEANYQIGRASCRARVCQYGYIAVGAVDLKKKHK